MGERLYSRYDPHHTPIVYCDSPGLCVPIYIGAKATSPYPQTTFTMAEESFVIIQQALKAPHPPIRVDVYHEDSLTQSVLEGFLETTADGVIGTAPAYGSKCVLGTLALSSAAQILVIRLSSSKVGNKWQKGKKKPAHTGRDLLRDLILCDSNRTKYAFQMDKLAAALHFDLDLRINQAIDLLSARKISTDRHSLAALLEVLGGELSLNKIQVSALFKEEENISTPIRATATQAWAAYQAAHLECLSKRLGGVAKIHTDVIIKAVSLYSNISAFPFDLFISFAASQYPSKDCARCRPTHCIKTNSGQERSGFKV